MKHEPLVSILMPFHNEKQFIKKRAKNINQIKYGHKEIICSNNASSDGSKKLIEDAVMECENLILLNQKKGVEAEKNWELCLNKSKGKYVMFAATDDFHDREFLQKGVSFLEKNESYDVWMPQINFIDFKGKKYLRPIKDTVILPIQKMGFADRIMYCVDGNINFLPYALYRGGKLRKTPISHLMGSSSCEQPFLLYVICLFKIYVDNESLVTFRLKINIPLKKGLHKKISDRIEKSSPFPPYHVVPDIKRLLLLADNIFAGRSARCFYVKIFILLGVLRSSWCSKEWYGRIKKTLWIDLWKCFQRRSIKDLLLLVLFVPLKIKPLRILISQHRNYRSYCSPMCADDDSSFRGKIRSASRRRLLWR